MKCIKFGTQGLVPPTTRDKDIVLELLFFKLDFVASATGKRKGIYVCSARKLERALADEGRSSSWNVAYTDTNGRTTLEDLPTGMARIYTRWNGEEGEMKGSCLHAMASSFH